MQDKVNGACGGCGSRACSGGGGKPKEACEGTSNIQTQHYPRERTAAQQRGVRMQRKAAASVEEPKVAVVVDQPTTKNPAKKILVVAGTIVGGTRRML